MTRRHASIRRVLSIIACLSCVQIIGCLPTGAGHEVAAASGMARLALPAAAVSAERCNAGSCAQEPVLPAATIHDLYSGRFASTPR